jgi:hypothetical protein
MKMTRQTTSHLVSLLVVCLIPSFCNLMAQGNRASPDRHAQLRATNSVAASVAFAKAVNYSSSGCQLESVAVGDVNGDGHPDIVAANFFNTCNGGIGHVSVLLGNGNGTFQPAANYGTGEVFPVSVAIADVNLDGYADLVVSGTCNLDSGGCNGSPGGVSVLLGNGNGTFQNPVTYGLAYGAGSVVIGDVNGDGRPDLVVASCGFCGSAQVSILLGNGNGTFSAPLSYSSGGGSVAIGDLNGDGHLDIAVLGSQTVNVMLGNGDGTFGAPVMYGTGGSGATSVAIADINGDGHLDVVVANVCQSGSSCQSGSAGVLLGKGDGTFQTDVAYLSGGAEPYSIAVADVNGDGKADLVLANECHFYAGCAGGGSTGVLGVLLGNGDGTFQSASRFDSGGYFAISAVIADVNGDGKPDLIVANYSSDSIDVLLNTTARSATTTTLTSSPNPSLVNQSVTFTATVTSAKPVPDGSTITFYAGTTQLGTGKTKGGIATLVTAFSKAKSYTIKAKYAGDGFHIPSSGTVTQIVKP